MAEKSSKADKNAVVPTKSKELPLLVVAAALPTPFIPTSFRVDRGDRIRSRLTGIK